MWNPSKAIGLVMQAGVARQSGDDQRAQRLIDEAIRMAEEAGSWEYAYQWKIQRALLFMKSMADIDDLVIAIQNSLDYHRGQGNRFRQLDLLINLTKVFSNAQEKSRAIQTIQQAESLLSTLSPNDVKEGLPIPPEILLSMRRNELLQLRQLTESPPDQ